MNKFIWQQTLFKPFPSRMDLLKLKPDWECRQLIIRIHRNHGFEHMALTMGPYFAYGGFIPRYLYSNYDDSLNFDLSEPADIEIIWIDTSLYNSNNNLYDWLLSRVLYLSQHVSVPILVCIIDESMNFHSVDTIHGVHFVDFSEIRNEFNIDYFDDRLTELSGCRLSSYASSLIARYLACRWIPPLISAPVKAIIVDLDNTLYSRVLGEDGPSNIKLSDGHVKLQKQLKKWKDKGVFLGLASKNNYEDVYHLFQERKDLILKWDDFTAHAIGWHEKSKSISIITEELRINTDSVLFIDDNLGELINAQLVFPKLNIIHANEDMDITNRALNLYPALWRWSYSSDDQLRSFDIKVSHERKKILDFALSEDDYFKNLEVKLSIHINPDEQLTRLSELCCKTNQFILTYQRYNQRQMASLIEDQNVVVVSIGLSDRLSNAGVIAVIVGHLDINTVVIDEICISCRALGRKLEDIMLLTACHLIQKKLNNYSSVVIKYKKGERNDPAIEWLGNQLNSQLVNSDGQVELSKIIVPRIESIKINIQEKNYGEYESA